MTMPRAYGGKMLLARAERQPGVAGHIARYLDGARSGGALSDG
jgi:hypothetical protein